ncbi:MAG: transposase [Ignavibacteriaceae bacterium]|nr:transposase [Ignavibacteriaceae bacterium]
MIDYSGQAVFADKGYANKARRKKHEALGIFDGIIAKGYRNKPLSKSDNRFSKILSLARNRVEKHK